MALLWDGSVWTWGSDVSGKLGDGQVSPSYSVTNFDGVIPLKVHGPDNVGYLTSIISISAGESHNLALRSDGTVWRHLRGSHSIRKVTDFIEKLRPDSPAFKVFSQRFPRVRLSALGDGLRRDGDNQASALVSAFRTKVEDPIRTFDDIEVVFDHQH